MADMDFSRSVEKEIQIREDRKFNGAITFTRSDSAAVDFSGQTIKMEIYKSRGGSLVDTLTSGTEITIATGQLTFNKTFTDLVNRAYYYQLFDDTDKVGIMHGNLIVS